LSFFVLEHEDNSIHRNDKMHHTHGAAVHQKRH